jgi:hypothetical protein
MPDRTSGDYRQVWITGTGQVISKTHDADKCAGEFCCVHNPSDHHMREWKTHLRGGGGFIDPDIFTERICPEHGVGHPDPDDPFAPGIHGCCGCCDPEKAKLDALRDLAEEAGELSV